MKSINENAFPETFIESLPEVLYKYRDWASVYHKRVITNSELFFSSPVNFNDIFDCNIPIATYLMKGDKKLQKEFAEKHVSLNFFGQHGKQIPIADLNKEVTKILMSGRLDNEVLMRKNMEDVVNGIRKNSGILSLTPHKNNILMWSHYANSHTGFCIGLKRDYFLNSSFGFMGSVQYANTFPIISPIAEVEERIVKQLFYKADVWKYEDEFRILRFGQQNSTTNFKETDIHEIILGTSMLKKDIETIISITRDKFKSVPLFKVIPKQASFEIAFERIQ